MASAAENEAHVIRDTLPDDVSCDGDVGEVGEERFDLGAEVDREGHIVDTRNESEKLIGGTENFMIHLGNTQLNGEQGSDVDRSLRDACDGRGLDMIVGLGLCWRML
jgi:hypothetical protein